MAACPRGHETAAVDYCDVCGSSVRPAAQLTFDVSSSPSGGGARCPVCGTPQTASFRFCEEDGYDFLLAPPVRLAAAPVSPPTTVLPASGWYGPTTVTSTGQVGAWQVAVGADRSYFEVVRAQADPGAEVVPFPRFVAERRFRLTGAQMLVGRRSRSRGVHPDIDLIGPPEDLGVSHVHALLVADGEGWAVVDLDSANGTYVNDPASYPITPNVPVPLRDGDRVYLGAWTSLVVSYAG
jgi:hypothetical protein